MFRMLFMQFKDGLITEKDLDTAVKLGYIGEKEKKDIILLAKEENKWDLT